jgi:hypothetical protein
MVTVGEQIDIEPQENSELVIDDRAEALIWLGRVQAADRIAETLRSETMRAMILVEEQNKYKALGFPTFVAFLRSPHSPLTKNQYYDRKKLLLKEGDQLFNLYPSLGISVQRRKLLGEGQVSLDGETVTVKNGEEQIEVDIRDRARIAELITALTDATAAKVRTLEKTELALDKAMDDNAELKKKFEDLKASKAAEFDGRTSREFAALLGCFEALIEESAKLAAAEKTRLAPSMLQHLAGLMTRLGDSLGGKDWTRHAPAVVPIPPGEDADAELAGEIFAEAVQAE